MNDKKGNRKEESLYIKTLSPLLQHVHARCTILRQLHHIYELYSVVLFLSPWRQINKSSCVVSSKWVQSVTAVVLSTWSWISVCLHHNPSVNFMQRSFLLHSCPLADRMPRWWPGSEKWWGRSGRWGSRPLCSPRPTGRCVGARWPQAPGSSSQSLSSTRWPCCCGRGRREASCQSTDQAKHRDNNNISKKHIFFKMILSLYVNQPHGFWRKVNSSVHHSGPGVWSGTLSVSRRV